MLPNRLLLISLALNSVSALVLAQPMSSNPAFPAADVPATTYRSVLGDFRPMSIDKAPASANWRALNVDVGSTARQGMHGGMDMSKPMTDSATEKKPRARDDSNAKGTVPKPGSSTDSKTVDMPSHSDSTPRKH